jgi:hypothetical protein
MPGEDEADGKKHHHHGKKKHHGGAAPPPPGAASMPDHIKQKYNVDDPHDDIPDTDSVLSAGHSTGLYRLGKEEEDAKETYWFEGYMIKACGAQRSWKERYFVLRSIEGEAVLAYFELPMSMDARCEKLLGQVAVQDAVLQLYPNGSQGGRVQKAYYFGITPVDSARTYLMAAESMQERSDWLSKLRARGAKVGQQVEEEALRVVDGSSYEGFLDKLAANERADSWKMRYFAVMPHKQKIYYYDSRWDAVKGKHCGRIRFGKGSTLVSEPPSKIGRKYVFSIGKPGDRRYVLAAANSDTVTAWLHALDEQVEQHR